MKEIQQEKVVSMGNNQLLFMPRLYDETMHLLVQARNYFNIYSQDDQQQLNILQRSEYSLVMSRITLRLSTVMSWILARRALHAGQITQEELDAHFRLAFQDECMKNSRLAEDFLPTFVNKLRRETLALYSRIHALDEIAYAHSA